MLSISSFSLWLAEEWVMRSSSSRPRDGRCMMRTAELGTLAVLDRLPLDCEMTQKQTSLLSKCLRWRVFVVVAHIPSYLLTQFASGKA